MKKHKNQKVIASPAYPEVLPWFARRAGIAEAAPYEPGGWDDFSSIAP